MRNDFARNAEALGSFSGYQDVINDMKYSILNNEYHGDKGELWGLLDAMEEAIRGQETLLHESGMNYQEAARLIDSKKKRQNFKLVECQGREVTEWKY